MNTQELTALKTEDQRNETAGCLYTAYCTAVGGVAYDGKPLPSWEEFSADPNKQKQADGWRYVALVVVTKSFKPMPTSLVQPKDEVAFNKLVRRDCDQLIQIIKKLPSSRERSLAITKLQEGVMWIGMDLKRIGEANPELVKDPYPESKKPENPDIAPTADGLKL